MNKLAYPNLANIHAGLSWIDESPLCIRQCNLYIRRISIGYINNWKYKTYSDTLGPHMYLTFVFFWDKWHESIEFFPTEVSSLDLRQYIFATFANWRTSTVLSPIHMQDFRQYIFGFSPLANVQLVKALLAKFENFPPQQAVRRFASLVFSCWVYALQRCS
jgi:hypothetical protein